MVCDCCHKKAAPGNWIGNRKVMCSSNNAADYQAVPIDLCNGCWERFKTDLENVTNSYRKEVRSETPI